MNHALMPTEPISLPHPERPLLLLDYDGTLAPIVDDPASAVPHPDVPALLGALANRYPLWIVTGRDVAALGSLLVMPGGATPDGETLPVMGLHGVQERAADGRLTLHLTEAERDALNQMRASVPNEAGVWVEDKAPSFAVHYRGALDTDSARASLRTWAADAPDMLAVIDGDHVVELRPRGVSKGTAVTRLIDRYPDRTPLYLGDDVTDEDAFAALLDRDPPGVTVKVGGAETTAAHRLPDVEAVVAYLRGFL